jgi:hypothetical protein
MADDVTWNNTSRHLHVYPTSSSSSKFVKLYPPSGNAEVAPPRGASALFLVLVVVPVVRSRRTGPSPSSRRARAHPTLSPSSSSSSSSAPFSFPALTLPQTIEQFFDAINKIFSRCFFSFVFRFLLRQFHLPIFICSREFLAMVLMQCIGGAAACSSSSSSSAGSRSSSFSLDNRFS